VRDAGSRGRVDGRPAAPRQQPIAIVGMRGRFPGADDLDGFWRNLADGVESITELDTDDLRTAGVPDHIARLPGYVNAAPLLHDVDEFDAGFFGYSARDAALTDPQHRVFLETAWEALEDAGYDPAQFAGAIGVFGGCEMSTYLYQLSQNPSALGYVDGMQLMVTNDKDHLCTQVSYRLDLRGPSVAVQTTCSTSLVAVAMACESLQAGNCDLALAGGSTVRVPPLAGYFYTAGSILSPDGHCRPFDARAQGTIVGSGVGIVVLKRLDEALADHDTIRAVIRGVGINNDGSDKAGYTAPGFKGQVEAITAAYDRAGVSPDTIGYVEAHGTGTILGDPIELSALTEVFRRHTDRRGYCGIGSLKSNVGHLSCASGVAGLIKTVLAVEHGAIPPTVHFTSPNPAIDFAAGPFYVTTSLETWHGDARPRRAAVSSFGVGGTNAHAVIEEAPPTEQLAPGRDHVVLTLSARSPEALDVATERLRTHLLAHPEVDLADAAHTLHVGRRAFPHRRSVVVRADDRSAAISALGESPPATANAEGAGEARPVVFMFPGQGSQYPGMARALYEHEPVVAGAIDRCCALLAPDLGIDLRTVLFPAPERAAGAADELRDTALAQPALFTVAYAVAELLRSWGIEPAAMIGHSIGEYVAATLAGVLTLDDTLRLLAHRGRLISSLPAGSMLAVMAPGDAVAELLDGTASRDPSRALGEVGVAALNGPGLCVLSGPTPAIARVEAALQARSVASRRLHTSHAFHSSMMDPILDRFDEIVRDVPLRPPTIPYVATLNGWWADGDVVQPSYWSRQIRSTVRFADGLDALASSALVGARAVLIEVGPGRSLSTFAAQTAADRDIDWATVPTLPAADERRPDTEVALTALARAWEHGAAVDWGAFHAVETRRRISLPTYPFERARYWIGPPVRPSTARDIGPSNIDHWLYEPVWRPSEPPSGPSEPSDGRVLVLDDGDGLGSAVAEAVRTAGATVTLVGRGDDFAALDPDHFRVRPGRADDFEALAAALMQDGGRLAGVVDCWAAAARAPDVDAAATELLLSPIQLAVALGRVPSVHPLPVLLVARSSDRVGDDDPLDPLRAFGTGVSKVIPQEHSGLRYGHVDVAGADDAVASSLLAELWAAAPDPDVAIRDGARYVRAFERIVDDDSAAPAGAPDADRDTDLPEDPVVLITGGMGHMGLILAASARARLGARLALVGRSTIVDPERLHALTLAGADGEALAAELERLAGRAGDDGGRRSDVLLVAADLDYEADVRAAVDTAIAHFGRIDVVVHGAANVSDAAFGAVVDTGPSVVAAQLTPKISGLLHLRRALAGREPQRWVIHSSISSVLGGLGLAAYAGANAVLDALAAEGGEQWMSIGWDAWDNAGEAQTAAIKAIQPVEGQEAFVRLMSMRPINRVVVATDDLDARIESWVRRGAPGTSVEAPRHARPNLTNPYVEPGTDTERELAEIWGSQLGIDRVGVHDRFFDLGGHSLLAVQMTSEIRDRFDIELPVPELFKAPTVADLSVLIDAAVANGGILHTSDGSGAAETAATTSASDEALVGEGPGLAAKASYREFYDDVSRQLAATGMAEASFFLNYGYLSLGDGLVDEAVVDVADEQFNASSVRLAHELIGATQLSGLQVLDVGSGRGGTVALLAGTFGATATGVDLSPEAVAFCRRAHRHPDVHFEVGDAEHLPCDDASFDVVTNLESSHTYPDIRAFLGEVRRVLRPGGRFLHADLLAAARWAEVRALLEVLGFTIESDREITPNVLASCDAIAAGRTEAFQEHSATMDNFLAVPGSPVYEQMASGAWEYRIVRSRLPVGP
jgi:phthiocerol/phenolphthiocerol synthesis type-I polyketide synthase E